MTAHRPMRRVIRRMSSGQRPRIEGLLAALAEYGADSNVVIDHIATESKLAWF